jgi:hypothetical protein
VRRDDRKLVWNLEIIEDPCTSYHHWKVGVGAHDDSDEWLGGGVRRARERRVRVDVRVIQCCEERPQACAGLEVGRPDDSYVAHLSTCTGLLFPVEVDRRPWYIVRRK